MGHGMALMLTAAAAGTATYWLAAFQRSGCGQPGNEKRRGSLRIPAA